MKKKTARALEKSIAHWDRLANNKARNGETVDGDRCALCDRFNELITSTPCEYRGEPCPVSNATKKDYCYGTPYYEARRWYRSKRHNAQCREFLYRAQEMRDFLIALREKP